PPAHSRRSPAPLPARDRPPPPPQARPCARPPRLRRPCHRSFRCGVADTGGQPCVESATLLSGHTRVPATRRQAVLQSRSTNGHESTESAPSRGPSYDGTPLIRIEASPHVQRDRVPVRDCAVVPARHEGRRVAHEGPLDGLQAPGYGATPVATARWRTPPAARPGRYRLRGRGAAGGQGQQDVSENGVITATHASRSASYSPPPI